MKEEIIKPGIVRWIIERVENENELAILPEKTDIILTAFLDTVADILFEGDMIHLLIMWYGNVWHQKRKLNYRNRKTELEM